MKNTIFFLLFAVVGSAQAQVVFSVDGTKITVEEFKKKFTEYKATAANPPTGDQLLEDWIRYEVGVMEAEKEKLQQDPAVKERFRQVMYNALMEKVLGKKLENMPITESDMKSYYRNNPEVKISEIFIEYPAKATDEQKEIARKRASEIYEDVKKQTKAHRPFEELVKLYSDDLSTKDSGGDIGYQSRISLAFYDTALKMRVGDISAPIDTKQGYYIAKVTARNTYEDADKRQIRAAVFDEKRSKMFGEYFDKLRKQYKIQVNKEALKAATS